MLIKRIYCWIGHNKWVWLRLFSFVEN